MAGLKNMSMVRHDTEISKGYEDSWDGTVEVTSRHTEKRTPHQKDVDKRKRVYHYIKIRYRAGSESIENVCKLCNKEYANDDNAVCVVNGQLWSQADVKIREKLLTVDERVEESIQVEKDKRAAEELLQETS